MSDLHSCILCESTSINLYHIKHDPKFGERVFYQCAHCALIFLHPKDHLNSHAEKKRYDTHNNHPTDQRYINFLKQLTNPLSHKLESHHIGLDYGCGPGPAIRTILKERGCQVSHFDPFYYPDQGLLKYQYDFITCTEVAEHFYRPRDEFIKLDQLLKGSHSFLGLMTQVLQDHINFSSWWYKNDPTHVCFYSPETLKWIAEWRHWAIEFASDNVIIYSK